MLTMKEIIDRTESNPIKINIFPKSDKKYVRNMKKANKRFNERLQEMDCNEEDFYSYSETLIERGY